MDLGSFHIGVISRVDYVMRTVDVVIPPGGYSGLPEVGVISSIQLGTKDAPIVTPGQYLRQFLGLRFWWGKPCKNWSVLMCQLMFSLNSSLNVGHLLSGLGDPRFWRRYCWTEGIDMAPFRR